MTPAGDVVIRAYFIDKTRKPVREVLTIMADAMKNELEWLGPDHCYQILYLPDGVPNDQTQT